MPVADALVLGHVVPPPTAESCLRGIKRLDEDDDVTDGLGSETSFLRVGMGHSVETFGEGSVRRGVGAAIDRLVPESLRRGDADAYRHARVLVAFTFAIVGLGIPYGLVYYHIGAYIPAAIVCACVCFAPLVLCVLHWTGSCVLAGNLAAVDFFVALTLLSMWMGGSQSPTIAWYCAMPIAAASLAGPRSGYVWLVVTLVFLAIFTAAECLGYRFHDELNADQHRWIGFAALTGLVLLIQVLSHLYEAVKNEMLHAIRQSENRFRFAAQTSSDLIYEWSVATDELRWFGDIDMALGYSSGTFPHTRAAWLERVHPEDRRNLRNAGRRDRVASTLVSQEYRIQHADGSWRFWIDRALPVLDAEGRPLRWVGTCTDITERAMAEERLVHANMHLQEETSRANLMTVRAEAANRSKSEFLANMSHEIRTPMTAIRGFAEILRDETLCCTVCPNSAACNIRRTNTDHVGTICRNTEYLLSLIDDILDLSKIEAGALTVEQIACSPFAIVAEIESLMRVRTTAKGLELRIEYDGAVPETIWTDPTRLRQILINLLGNAVKFTEAGVIRLIVRYVAGESPVLRFDVVDMGVGMTPAQVARLFQPFTQADGSMTRRFGGTGLGLVISRKLAQLLGGDVVILETQLGVGTRFQVTVGVGPIGDVRMLTDPVIAHSADHGEKEEDGGVQEPLNCRILLAEDGVDNQRLVGFILKKAGAEVTVVENGQQAVDAALSARSGGTSFGAILMDMQMPVMDGYEATRQLRRQGYTGPIIALTAHAMATDREKCLSAGCDEFVTKPIDRKKLLGAVRRFMAIAV